MNLAYEQLSALPSRLRGQPLWQAPEPNEFDHTTATHAAILILFGVLDGVPSEHSAQAVGRDLDVLLLTRATTLRSHPGQVAFPGGRVDPGDADIVATALREAQEETGLNPAGVEVLGTLEPLPLPFSGHAVTPVLGWWRDPSPVGVVDHAESSDVFRAPVADLLDPANRSLWEIPQGDLVRTGPAWELTVHERHHVVWGFTAGILDRLFARLGWEEPWDSSRRTPIAIP